MDTAQWTQAVMEQLRGLPTQDKQIELLLLVNSQLVAEVRRLQCLLDTTTAVINSEFHKDTPTAAVPSTTTTTTSTSTASPVPTPKAKKVAAPPPSPRGKQASANGADSKSPKKSAKKMVDDDEENEEEEDTPTTPTKKKNAAETKPALKKRKIETAEGTTTAEASPKKKSAANTSASATATPQQNGAAGAEESKTAKKKRKRMERELAEKAANAIPSPKSLPPGPLPEKTKCPTRKGPGGLTFVDIQKGHGTIIADGKMVTMKYKGYLRDGKMFDSSDSFQFRFGLGQVIKGWDKGLKGMKEGGKRKLVLPPNMAYGKSRTGKIPPNSTLCFDVELVKVH